MLSTSGTNIIVFNNGSYASTTNSVDCPITYSLTGDSDANFNINSATGAVSFYMPSSSGTLKYKIKI